jgi:hypothetical protein
VSLQRGSGWKHVLKKESSFHQLICVMAVHYKLNCSTSVPMCAISENRCVPFVFFGGAHR